MQDEYSPGGSKIYRHGEQDFKQDLEDLGESSLEEIDAHITKHLGEPIGVFHEIVSPTVHVDVHLVGPTTERNFNTLITSGMSDKPMNDPLPNARFAELVIMLPPDWNLDQKSFEDENNYWPIRQLKSLARFPHEYNTWLWADHTVPNGNPPKPFASNTEFCSMIVAYPVSLPLEFHRLRVNEEKEISFFALIPLFQNETDFKLQKGSEALYQMLDKAGANDRIDISRASCIKKSWLGGLFRK
jgi:Suppressor of fused protein (SUFU)